MADISIQQVNDEPIVLYTFRGAVKPEDVSGDDVEIAAIVERSGGEVVLIADVREATLSFGDLLRIVRQTANENVSDDPEFVDFMMVGGDEMTKLYVEMARQPQNGGVDIPIFNTLDDAIAAARVQVAAYRARRLDNGTS